MCSRQTVVWILFVKRCRVIQGEYNKEIYLLVQKSVCLLKYHTYLKGQSPEFMRYLFLCILCHTNININSHDTEMPNTSSLTLIKLLIFLGYQFVHDYFGLYFCVINLYMIILVYISGLSIVYMIILVHISVLSICT